MLHVLANRTYRHLFLAQMIALVGTGLATVALGLLAYDIAGGDAGAVLGTALAIKMIAYIGVAPMAGAFSSGRMLVQGAKAFGQRGLKGQPGGMAESRGIEPGIVARRSAVSARVGIAPMSPCA